MKATSTRQQLQQAISRLTRRKANGESLPNVSDIALRLSSRYLQSGMTIDEICAEISAHLERAQSQYNCQGLAGQGQGFGRD
jgi:hypothetical protein